MYCKNCGAPIYCSNSKIPDLDKDIAVKIRLEKGWTYQQISDYMTEKGMPMSGPTICRAVTEWRKNEKRRNDGNTNLQSNTRV